MMQNASFPLGLDTIIWSCHFRTFRSCFLVSAQNPPV